MKNIYITGTYLPRQNRIRHIGQNLTILQITSQEGYLMQSYTHTNRHYPLILGYKIKKATVLMVKQIVHNNHAFLH